MVILLRVDTHVLRRFSENLCLHTAFDPGFICVIKSAGIGQIHFSL
jgi:hypothetical protein